MGRTVNTRIAAAVIAVVATLSLNAVHMPTLANSAELGISLGVSGGAPGTGGELSPGASDEWEPPLGISRMLAPESRQAGTFAELKEAIGTTGDVYVTLTNDVTMTSTIDIGEGRRVTVDGDNRWKLIQKDSATSYYFDGAKDSEVTLKDVEVEGRTQYGIIRSTGANGKGIFEDVTYIGSQPYYGSGGNNEMIIRGGYFEMKRQTGSSIEGQEFSECARVTFDGGKTVIRHAAPSNPDKNGNGVFYMVHGTSGTGSINLVNEADVTIESGNYVLFTAMGAVAINMGRDTRLDITAAAFNRGTDGHRHPVGNVTLGENAYFSYKQQGTANTSDAFKVMYINGNMELGKNSTFLIDTTTYGLWHSDDKAFTADRPQLVSIHGATSAFHSLSGKPAGTWLVNDINAVNYWTTGDAAPSADSSANSPDHMWNSWRPAGGAFQIGPRFSFSASGASGVTWVNEDMADVLGRHETTLSGTLTLDGGARRLVFGNLDPFTVEKLRSYEGMIKGSVLCSDITASYPARDGASAAITAGGLPMDLEGYPSPLPGGTATLVANMDGLRAAVLADIDGALELVAVPEYIHYGKHPAPGGTIVYHRQKTSSVDADGNMLVEVLDTRGDTGGPWQLMVKAVEEAVEGKELLPSSALLFVTHSGEEYYLDEGPARVYIGGVAGSDYERYPITWNDDQGLLIKARRGQLAPGDYAAVLNWSVQNAP